MTPRKPSVSRTARPEIRISRRVGSSLVGVVSFIAFSKVDLQSSWIETGSSPFVPPKAEALLAKVSRSSDAGQFWGFAVPLNRKNFRARGLVEGSARPLHTGDGGEEW